jgi:hypothetical protein
VLRQALDAVGRADHDVLLLVSRVDRQLGELMALWCPPDIGETVNVLIASGANELTRSPLE